MMSASTLKVAILDFEPGKHFEVPEIEQAVLGDDVEIQLIRARAVELVLPQIVDADAIIVWSRFELNSRALNQLQKCKGVVCASVGYDHVDLVSASEKGMVVCNVPDYGTEEVADHTMALMLSLVRKITRLNDAIHGGVWDWKQSGPVGRLRGQHLGIVGFGRIGSAVGRRAQSFGIDVSFYDPYIPRGIEKSHGMRRHDCLADLLKDSELISLHAPLSEETRGMMNDETFKHVKSNAFLINAARGPLVESAALVRALSRGQLAGAGLDVLEHEPSVPPELLQSPSVILTPHSAWCSDESFAENRTKAATAALAILQGKLPHNIVNNF